MLELSLINYYPTVWYKIMINVMVCWCSVRASIQLYIQAIINVPYISIEASHMRYNTSPAIWCFGVYLAFNNTDHPILIFPIGLICIFCATWKHSLTFQIEFLVVLWKSASSCVAFVWRLLVVHTQYFIVSIQHLMLIIKRECSLVHWLLWPVLYAKLCYKQFPLTWCSPVCGKEKLFEQKNSGETLTAYQYLSPKKVIGIFFASHIMATNVSAISERWVNIIQ